jgi:CheY-like chemotaxis protein
MSIPIYAYANTLTVQIYTNVNKKLMVLGWPHLPMQYFRQALPDDLNVCLGCECHRAKDGSAATDLPPPSGPRDAERDLIQMEIALPGQTGWALICGFKADPASREIPIYVVTAYGLLFKERHRHERVLIAAEMEKPIDMTRYTQMVRRVLREIDGERGEKIGAAA